MIRRRASLFLPFFLTVAFITRILQLSGNPPGLFRDEVEKLYHAWTIWNCGGITLEGQIFPVFFRIEGATTSGIYHYFAAPFVQGLFPTPFLGRIIIALVGILTILAFITFIGRLLSPVGAILAGILFTFSPWHFLFSRWIQQGIFLPLFLMTFLLFTHAALTKKNYVYVFLSGISLGLTMYSYAIAVVLVPLIIVGMLLIISRKYDAGQWAVFFCGLALLTIPVIEQQLALASPEPSRFARISVFNSASPAIEFIRNYIQHISPYNLFIAGDANLRHSYPGLGMFHWYTVPFFFSGLVYLLINHRKIYYRLILWILLISPVPASLTMEGIPHYLRAIPLLLMIEITIGLGFILFFLLIPRILKSFTPLIAVNLVLFFFAAFYFYPRASAQYWDGKYFSQSLSEARILQREHPYPLYISSNILYRHYLYAYYSKLCPHQMTLLEENQVYFDSELLSPPFLALHYRPPVPERPRNVLSSRKNLLFDIRLVE